MILWLVLAGYGVGILFVLGLCATAARAERASREVFAEWIRDRPAGPPGPEHESVPPSGGATAA